MQQASLLVRMEEGLDLVERATLSDVVARVLGVYQVYYQCLQPGCHGLMICYDPNLVDPESILQELRQEVPERNWMGCRPEYDCVHCRLSLH